MKYFTGVGSREIPKEYQDWLKIYAKMVTSSGYICRTGDAKGSDQIFREYSKFVDVYSPKDVIKMGDTYESK